MAWSGGLASIRLPSDATGTDGRNYIDIGEEVPSEVTDHFTAGLFFRSGSPNSGQYGFNYWAIGITDLGALEVVAFYYIDASAGLGAFQYFRRTLLSFAPPIGVDKPPITSIGPATGYASYGEGSSRVIVNGWQFSDLAPDGLDMAANGSLMPGWSAWIDSIYGHMRYIPLASGIIAVTGLVTYSGGVGASTRITGHGGPYAPRDYGALGSWQIINGSVGDTPRLFNVQPDGIYLRGALPPNGTYVSINGFYISNSRSWN